MRNDNLIRLSKIVLFAITLLIGKIGNAQIATAENGIVPDLKSFAVKTYTINDGLPSKTTRCAIKDKNGFIWIGTENGLCRFDGYTFKTFVNVPGDTTTLSNNYISTIIEDKKGRIWVGTLDGLNLLDPSTEKFSRLVHQDNIKGSLSNNSIWSLLADRENTIWIGTDDGFDRFIESTGKFETFRPNMSNPNAMKGKSVNAIIEDKSGFLWLGNWDGGLNQFDKKTKKFINYRQEQRTNDKNPNDVWSLCLDDMGNIWVGTYWKGLFRFDIKTHLFTATASLKDNRSVFRIVNLGHNVMLLAGLTSFFLFDPVNTTWKKLPGLTSFQQAGIFKDDGIIWVCSVEGLTKLDSRQYKFALNPFPVGKTRVKSILTKDNKLWIGSNSGLSITGLKPDINGNFPDEKIGGGPGRPSVNKLYVDLQNKLWALSETGFDEYDGRTGNFVHHTHHSSLRGLFNEDSFRDIVEANDGDYWLATDAGLKIYHPSSNTFTHYFNQPGKPYTLSINHLFCLQKDGGTMWVGTIGGGLNRFEISTHRFYHYLVNDKKKNGISNNDIHGIFLDSRGNIWICTQDGLNKYIRSTDSFKKYSKTNGFASNVFKQMTEDASGNLWVLTETGLSSLDPLTDKVVNFDEADGIFASSAICRVSNNQLAVAGNKGLILFDPLAIKYNRVLPPVYFSDFQIFNKSIKPDSSGTLTVPIQNTKKIVLDYSQSVFSIEFVALNYTHTEKNRYAYKLEGFDKKWIYAGEQRKATYTNLNPGTYVFHVKASNNDDRWNEQAKSLIIVITPPWYLAWWAYIAYALLSGTVVYAYINYNARQAKLKYEVKLAYIETEKEKELYERKLSFFTNISHEFRTPLTMIINPLKELLYAGAHDSDQQSLNTINRNAKRLLSLVDQLLLFRKADANADELKLSEINMAELGKEVFLCFTHQARAKGLRFEFFCQQDNVPLIGDSEKIEIILFNLLSNAIKFSKADGTVELRIEDTPDRVIITIKDNGCGIATATGDRLYHKYFQEYRPDSVSHGGLGIGLFLVKTYTEQHSGKVSYDSEPGKGTMFSLEFIKGRAHFDPTVVIKPAPAKSDFLAELVASDAGQNINERTDLKKAMDANLSSDFKSILIIEDNKEIGDYIKQLFVAEYIVYEADNGESGLKMTLELMPDMVISDVMMPGMSGIELCALIKENPELSHIPVILLTAITAPEIKLTGIEGGADDYINKPFEKEMLIARVKGLLKSRNQLQQYFFNEVTLKKNDLKISQEYRDFLQKCLEIVERHLHNPNFSIKTLATEIGMSHSNVYRKIKSISGQSANGFIRFIRLRKAAEIFLTTDSTVSETAYKVGFQDPKHFREQFFKLFGMNPSEYIKKFRNAFHNDQTVNLNIVKKRSL